MKAMKLFGLILAIVALISPLSVWAQATSSTGFITGTVTDPGGAVIPNANAELENTATHAKLSTTTNAAGVYVFSSVPPGAYKLTITAQGFRTWEVSQMSISIARSYTRDAQLEIGAMTEKVEVVATAAAELHTHDASVGNVYGGQVLLRMPTRNRSVASLLQLQPLVMPARGSSTDTGGQVAGARSDQTVYLLDGGDVTNNTEGSGGYITGFQAGEAGPAVPVPQESIEEFRVGTTNPNASFGRSMGAQATMITKSGTNELHGSAYWYHQNDNLDSHVWQDNNAIFGAGTANESYGRNKPEKKDNRYGFSAGGPVWKDWTHIYGNFEGRRFPRSVNISRIVPTSSLRNGVIFVRGGTACAATTAPLGCINLNPDPVEAPPALFGAFNPAVCTGGNPCDPLGLGMSPTTEAFMALYPQPNDFGIGSEGNTAGFTGAGDNSITDDFFVVKLDQKLTDKWNSFFSYRYNRDIVPGTLAGALPQVDIAGLTCSTPPCTTRQTQSQPRFFIIGLNGQLTPTLTSETRLFWTRSWWAWTTTNPAEARDLENAAMGGVPLPAAAIDLGGEGAVGTISDPINIDTQNARSRSWDGDDYVAQENITWVRGKHTVQFGGSFRQEHIIHVRTDRVTGGLTTGPIFYLQDGSFLNLPASARPASVAGGARSRYFVNLTSVLGLVDRSAQVLVRDFSDLTGTTLPSTPLGTSLVGDVDIYAVDAFVQDIFRITPTLTFTYGLTWQVQRPPDSRLGNGMVPIYGDTLQPIDLDIFFANRRDAALRGENYLPSILYQPNDLLHGFKYGTKIDWNNYAPRLALAWNPAFDNFLFGNRKTVIRAGWGVNYARMNGVGLVMTPILGVGPAGIVGCNGPMFDGVTCNGLRGALGTTVSTAFRIGQGVSPTGVSVTPSAVTPCTATIPFDPTLCGEVRNFAIDPGLKLGKSHSFDLTWQRELPGNMLIEIGFVSRLGKGLTQNADVNDVPFMFTDPGSGQVALAAFENVACEVRQAVDITAIAGGFETGVCPNGAAVRPVIPAGADLDGDGDIDADDTQILYISTMTAQPFFENQLNAQIVALGGIDCADFYGEAAGTSCTQALVNLDFGAFQIGDFGNLMLFDVPTAYGDLTTELNNWTTDGGKSFFNSGFVTLRKRMSYGLQFDVNYTYGRSTDDFGLNQENTGFSYQTMHNRKLDRGLSIWDRRHVMNATVYYELPFGRGKTWATESGVMDKIVGGWHISGIYQASSGLPICLFAATNAGAANNDGGGCARPLALPYNSGGNSPHALPFDNAGTNVTDIQQNLYADPLALHDSFRRCTYTGGVDGRCGNEGTRGLPHWNLDFSLGKRTSVTERVAIAFSMDVLNFFNHMEFNDPGGDFDAANNGDSGSTFGRLNSQFGGTTDGPRRIQFGIRVEF